MVFYADTSALVKLVVREKETTALREWLRADRRELVTCDLTRTELTRAVRRASPESVLPLRTLLDSISILTLSTTTFATAGWLDPTPLRSLDAIHVAAALELGDDLDAVLVYDSRLAEAAITNGLPVIAPR